MDGSGFIAPVGFAPQETPHDLTTPRGRLLYLRDVVVPFAPEGEIDMSIVDCGTHACLIGWYERIRGWADEWGSVERHFGITRSQFRHIFMPAAYGGVAYVYTPVTHAELTAHIDDVLTGRVR